MDTAAAVPNLAHLIALTGPHGLFEHAEHATPRVAHGYCTDDNARALVVLAGMNRAHAPDFEPYLGLTVAGRVPGGWHNRMSPGGEWIDRRGSDDAHGRALWGLGAVLAAGVDTVADTFIAGLDFESHHARPNAYAVLGGVEAYRSGLVDGVERFVAEVAARLPRRSVGHWAWPEPALVYDNARLPEALIRAGSVLGDPGMAEHGLALLDWLVDVERGPTGFSFTPVGGRRPGETGPAFDQQPLEAWAMADACLAAAEADPGGPWLARLEDAVMWFLGRNDVGVALYDPATGAGFDGLEVDGVNRNRGAESTLSALGALCAWARAGTGVPG